MKKRLLTLVLVLVLALSMVPTAFAASAPAITYYSHCQNIGDTGIVSNGMVCGTQGQSLRMEKLNIKLDGISGGIEIQGHVQDYGWMNISSATAGRFASCGTSGESRRLEAIRIRLTGYAAMQYSIQYRVHVQDYGTMNWVSDFGIAGTSGESKRIESVEIKLVPKGTNGFGLSDVTSQFANKRVTIKSVENGKYLCADTNINGNSPLCSNRDSVSDWESFTFSSVTSDGWIGLKAYNGLYLSANTTVTNTPVYANVGTLAAWECFRVYTDGSNYYLFSQSNNKYLCVRTDTANAPVQAYADVASTWERLKIEVRSSETSSNSNNTSNTGYAIYNGIDYTKSLAHTTIGKEYQNRLDILNAAQKMCTVLWTAPCTFHTWKATNQTYNSNKSLVYSENPSTYTSFVKGVTYQGIPYAANAGHNTYDDVAWGNYVNNASNKFEGTVSYRGVSRNNCCYSGIDCSGFVYNAYKKISSYNLGYLTTDSLLSSSKWHKISKSEAKPGDILLKSGHVMIYAGTTATGKIAVFESCADFSGCKYNERSSISGYNFYRFENIGV